MPKLLLYNTLHRAKEEFHPRQPGKVGLYVCGPTVYNYDHIGHGRTYVVFDVLVRLLRHWDYTVTYVQNITDVGHLIGDVDNGEDKITQQAVREHKSTQEIARFYEQAHWQDMENLGNLHPSDTPHASAFIAPIITLIQRLLKEGYAYAAGGNVYFSVEQFAPYGQLSRRSLSQLVEGTRVAVEPDKRHPADFALWKAAKPGESLTFPSPWGDGTPGWHIECSVMSRELLGQPFDIHGSAVEHVFPHHENEIAQSQAAYGTILANYWLHTGLLTLQGKKMSKSLGNVILVRELLKRYPYQVVRLVLLSTHYRKPLDYQEELLEQWQRVWQDIVIALAGNLAINPASAAVKADFINALADDLNTPAALGILTNRLAQLTPDDLSDLLALLGIYYTPAPIPTEVTRLVETRQHARDSRNWALADQLRHQIEARGYILEDHDGETKILPKLSSD